MIESESRDFETEIFAAIKIRFLGDRRRRQDRQIGIKYSALEMCQCAKFC